MKFPILTLLAAALFSLSLSPVMAAPQAVALGPRPAVKAEPIMIPDEEALGQEMDRVLEPSKEEPVDISKTGISPPPAVGNEPVEKDEPVPDRNVTQMPSEIAKFVGQIRNVTMTTVAAKKTDNFWTLYWWVIALVVVILMILIAGWAISVCHYRRKIQRLEVDHADEMYREKTRTIPQPYPDHACPCHCKSIQKVYDEHDKKKKKAASLNGTIQKSDSN